MKKLDINFKDWTGVVVAVVTGVAAFAGAIADKNKTSKMEELIKKVETLTEEK